jgi:hypothetical protein
MVQPASDTYFCAIHTDVRQQRPGNCPKCGIALLPVGTRFAIVHHTMSRPLHHLLIGAATVILTLIVLLMVVRRGF